MINPQPLASFNKEHFLCICVDCMDRRINANATHGIEVFKMSNAGASFPLPTTQQSAQEDSLHILMERAKEFHQTVVAAFSGHEDCTAVRNIWQIGNRLAGERSERDDARLAPYAALVNHIRSIKGIEEAEQLRLLTQAKTLQDINHAFTYEDIREVVAQNELGILAYFEDVVKEPRRLYLFDPEQNLFARTTIRLKEFLERPELIERYALKSPVDVAAFIDEKAAIYIKRRYDRAIKAMVIYDDEIDQPNKRLVKYGQS